MSTNTCVHEDWVTYGEVISQDATTRLIKVECEDCKAKGIQSEHWDDDSKDYSLVSEVW